MSLPSARFGAAVQLRCCNMKSIVALSFILLALAVAAPLAAAHVTKTVGAYSIKVGWANEPPVTGERNQITMQIWNTGTRAGATGLADTLTVKVTMGTNSKTLAMEESDEGPGNYSASILPTQAGLLVVHVDGTIGSNQVSQTFNVEEVQDAGGFAFPSGGSGTGVTMTDLQNEVQSLQTRLDKVEAEQQKQSNRIPGVGVEGAVLAMAGAAALLLIARRR